MYVLFCPIDTLPGILLNRGMALTNNDLRLIKNVMKITIDEELDIKFEEKLKYLPSREEFFSRTDEIMGELKAMREEHIMLSHRVYGDHEPRIEKIEKKFNIRASD
jgi:hypothetical protein